MKKLGAVLAGLMLASVMMLGLVACTEANVAVASISVASKPTKTEYWEGETLDTTGLTVKVKYEEGKKEDETISEGFTVDKTQPLTAKDTKVTVTYQEKKATFNITVKVDTMTFALQKLPTKLDYSTDKTVDLTGIKAVVTSAKDGSKDVAASELKGTLNDDILTVSYGEYSAAFTVKTGVRQNMPIGSQEWYGTTNEPNLLGTWDVKDEGKTAPTVDTEKSTVTFTYDTWSRLPIFCVKYPKNDGTIYEPGNNIGAEVNDHVDGQVFGYTLNVNTTGSFRMGFLLANSAVYALTDANAMGLMLHFDGNKLTLATNEGGGTSVILAESTTSFENNKDNRIDFTFERAANKVTFKIWVNDVRVYFNDVNISAHSTAELQDGNFTFMAGRYKNEESDKTNTGYKNWGNRLGIYADEGTTVVLSDCKA